jgi:hypothetical protein
MHPQQLPETTVYRFLMSNALLNGRRSLQQPTSLQSGTYILIDECLAVVPLAEALTLVDYNALSVSKVFGQGAQDDTIIQWLGLRGGIWVTGDEKAKHKYAVGIKKAGIHIVWVHRHKKYGMSKKDQLKLLLWVLDPILEVVSKTKGPAQFQTLYSGIRPVWKQLY